MGKPHSLTLFSLYLFFIVPASAFAEGGYTRTGTPCIALTFDDGPSKEFTPELLETLRANKAHATFYVLGEEAVKHPDIIREEVRDGNELGNHSWDHPHPNLIKQLNEQREYADTDKVLEEILNTKAPTATLRGPYGLIRTKTAAAFTPRRFIFWNLDTLDWKYQQRGWISYTTVNDAKAGTIALMHDIHPETVAAVPDIIRGLRERGFVFVTVSEMLRLCTYNASS